MSHLEYLVAIAYHLGSLDKDFLEVDFDRTDGEDKLILCQAVLEVFYKQREYAYIGEFLDDLHPQYFEDLYEELFS